ncbi:MAG: adhesin [Methanobrevibacter sp.]|jgi:hypothetical protein|nr:adhesin [Candidatus Methanoflexus mossambicus]
MKKFNLKALLKKFTIVDYVIIIIVILAIIFAFIQITGEDKTETQSASFDSSSIGKFMAKYYSFYKDGYIVKSKVIGYNATSNEKVDLDGTILWADDSYSAVKVLLDVNGSKVLASMYSSFKESDVYIEQITLETDGNKYKNVTDITVKPIKLNKLSDLIKNIPDNMNFTITNNIAIKQSDSIHVQKLNNLMLNNFKKMSIYSNDISDHLYLIKATPDEISSVSAIFSSINGETNSMTIRIFNCDENQLNIIKNNFEVKTIDKIT